MNERKPQTDRKGWNYYYDVGASKGSWEKEGQEEAKYTKVGKIGKPCAKLDDILLKSLLVCKLKRKGEEKIAMVDQ